MGTCIDRCLPAVKTKFFDQGWEQTKSLNISIIIRQFVKMTDKQNSNTRLHSRAYGLFNQGLGTLFLIPNMWSLLWIRLFFFPTPIRRQHITFMSLFHQWAHIVWLVSIVLCMVQCWIRPLTFSLHHSTFWHCERQLGGILWSVQVWFLIVLHPKGVLSSVGSYYVLMMVNQRNDNSTRRAYNIRILLWHNILLP